MAEHSHPVDGATCMCCWDDLSQSSYVEYRWSSESSWLPSGFCQVCVEQLLKTQWNAYKSALEKTTCKAEQRRLLARGPPINISDPKALPCPEGLEVHSLWYMSDNSEHSAKLEGSLIGEERQKFWDDQSAFYITDEADDSEGVERKEGSDTVEEKNGK